MTRPGAFLKRFLPHSLLGRSLLIIVTPLILLQVVIALVFYERHWDTITRHRAGSLAGEIAMVIDLMRTMPGPENEAWILEMARHKMGLRATVRKGEILPNTSPTPRAGTLDRMLAHALAERVRRPFAIDTRSFGREVEINIQLPDGVLQVFAPRKRLFSSTTYIFVMWMTGTSLILFAVATMFMRNQVRPIRRLAAAADSFGKGRDVPDFKPSGATEVRQAAAAFLLMRERIKRQIVQRTEMLAGVSHDLRTPLTRMKLQHAMLGDSPEVAELKSDVAEMDKMLDEYLAFAQGEGTEKPVPIDVSALLDQIVSEAQREGKEIEFQAESDMTLTVRPNAFKRCVTNLVRNATLYGDHVSVRAGRRDDAIEITIDDDGPGIPEDQREEVFRPFYRLDPSRNPDTGGVGLGLAIARDVAHSHGGDIVLGDSPRGGLRVQLRLPV